MRAVVHDNKTTYIVKPDWWCAGNNYLNIDAMLSSGMESLLKVIRTFQDIPVNYQPSSKTTGSIKVTVYPKTLDKVSFHTGTKMSDGATVYVKRSNEASTNFVPLDNRKITDITVPLGGEKGDNPYIDARWSGWIKKLKTMSHKSVLEKRLLPLLQILNASRYSDYRDRISMLFTIRAGHGKSFIDKPTAKHLIALLSYLKKYEVIGDSARRLPGSNPMLDAGFAPGDTVLDKLFKGLLGDTVVAKNNKLKLEGLLGEIYSLGDPPKLIGDSPVTNIVAQHFSLVQRTELVGVHIISGVAAIMSNISSAYHQQFKNFIEKAKDAKAMYTQGTNLALVAVFGNLAKPWFNYDKVQAQTAITISLAKMGQQMMWLPITLFVMTTLFVTGIVFSLLIPLTPYILFWAGKIAWILLVIEAMIAVPVMAIALLYPDGNDVWGQAEPGMKMSINLLLMPVLMVMGLLAGIVLTYVVIYFSAKGFHTVATGIFSFISAAAATNSEEVTVVAQGILACFLVFIYATFISMAFNKCFSAIYIIPEKVMMWISVQGRKFGEQAMQEMKSAVTQTAQQAGSAGGQSLTQGVQADQQVAKASTDAQFQQADAEMGIAEGISSATKSAARAIATKGLK